MGISALVSPSLGGRGLPSWPLQTSSSVVANQHGSTHAFVSAGPHAPDKHFANVPWQRLGDSEMAAEVKGYLSG